MENKRKPEAPRLMGSNDFAKYLQSKGLSNATVKHYTSQVLDFIVWCDMANSEPENAGSVDVMGYLKQLQDKGHQNKTRSYRLGILKHFFNWQISRGQRQDNPADHIKIRGTQHRSLYPVFSKEELESMYYSYEVPPEDHVKSNCNWFANYRLSKQRNKVVLGLMVYQGLCTDEVNRLVLSDMRLREGVVYVSGSRKSNERILALKPHQIMELMEYQLVVRAALQKLSSHASELYFLPTPAAGRKGISSNEAVNIWKGISRDIKKGNKKFINFLQVRASVITYWLQHYNLREVQYMAGHRYVSSTERYLVNQMDDLQSDIEKFHPIG